MTSNLINTLQNIDEVHPFGKEANDEACFNELREVLKKHNKLERFGMCLLHKHFDVTSDEILVESCDTQNRTLTIQPEKANINNEGNENLMETNWRFSDQDDKNPKAFTAILVCREGAH